MNNLPSQIREERMVIVDYDNLDVVLRRSGLFNVIWKILEKVVDEAQIHQPKYVIRLYGGWYEKSALTRAAQDLTIEIGQAIPLVFPLIINGSQLRVPISIELAYSLAVLPARHLLATYRPRGIHGSVRCHAPAQIGCNATSCPVGPLYTIFINGRCSESNCSKSVQDFLYRGEQKLVDSMMLSDLIFFSQNGGNVIALVSSDDDLWPGILTGLHSGSEIRHIRTRPQTRDYYGYASNLPGNYKVSTIS